MIHLSKPLGDAYLARLWKWLSEEPEYAGQTTLFITTDDGRGRTPYTWQNHNDRLPGARSTWLALVSPNVGQRGEWSHHRRVYSSEIAATFARLGGYDLADESPRSAGPIEFLIAPP